MTGQSLVDLCKHGLSSSGLISLSNSVNLADAPRLEEVSLTHRDSLALRLAKLLSGKLLLCKVFIGQCREIQTGQRLVTWWLYLHSYTNRNELHSGPSMQRKLMYIIVTNHQVWSRRPGSGLLMMQILCYLSTLFTSHTSAR